MVIVFSSYVSFIWLKYGIQRSISNSYYRLPNRLKFLFTLFCWGFAYPAMMLSLNPLMFFAGTLICLVGVASAFKSNKILHISHMVGAYGGVALSMISIWIDFNMWYLTVAFIVISGLLMMFKNKLKNNQIWWIEILAFSSICYALFINNN